MNKHNTKKIRGFTLIELLVVVSIIALLVSILLPALGKARTQAKKAVCAAQLRQLGMGVYEYAVSNEMYLPLYTRADANRYGFSGTLYYVNCTKLWGDENNTGETQPRLLDPYLGKKVQECPLDKGFQPEVLNHSNSISRDSIGQSFYEIYGTSYIYNTGLEHDTAGRTVSSLGDPWPFRILETLYNKKISSIRTPSLFCMAGDRTWTLAEYYTAPSMNRVYKKFMNMHSPDAPELNMVFVDGHVAKTEILYPPDHLRNNEYYLVPANH